MWPGTSAQDKRGEQRQGIVPSPQPFGKVESKMSFSGLSLNFPKRQGLLLFLSAHSPSPVSRAVSALWLCSRPTWRNCPVAGWPVAAAEATRAFCRPLPSPARRLCSLGRGHGRPRRLAFLSAADSSFGLCPGPVCREFSFQVKERAGDPAPGSPLCRVSQDIKMNATAVPSGAGRRRPAGVRK